MRYRVVVCGVVGCSLLAAGCALVTPVKDESRFFLLTAQPLDTAEAAPVRVRKDLLVGVGPLRLPNYLKRSEIVERLVGAEVRYSPTARWAEPLEASTVWIVAQELSQALGVPGVVAYPWGVGTLPEYAIPIQVIRFENDGGGTVRFDARWAIRDSKSKRLVHVAESQITKLAPTPDTAGTVNAMGAALSEFSQEIAAAIRRLVAEGANPSGGRSVSAEGAREGR